MNRRSFLSGISTAITAALAWPREAFSAFGIFQVNGPTALPAGVNLLPIDGGPTYWTSNGFTFGANAGFDSKVEIASWPSSLPLIADYNQFGDLNYNEATFILSNGDQTLAGTGSPNNIYWFPWLQDTNSTAMALVRSSGAETIGFNTADEPTDWIVGIGNVISGTTNSLASPAATTLPNGRPFWTDFTLSYLGHSISNTPGAGTPAAMLYTLTTTRGGIQRHVDMTSSDFYFIGASSDRPNLCGTFGACGGMYYLNGLTPGGALQNATSTSITVPTSFPTPITFTTSTNRNFQIGAWCLLARGSDFGGGSSNYVAIIGQITAYSNSSGSMTINVPGPHTYVATTNAAAGLSFLVDHVDEIVGPQNGGSYFPPVTDTTTPGNITTNQLQKFFITSGGTGYTNGSYPAHALANITGAGSGATANITVSGGAVTSVSLVTKGTGYAIGDTFNATGIGPGTGFAVTVTIVGTLFQGASSSTFTLPSGAPNSTWNFVTTDNTNVAAGDVVSIPCVYNAVPGTGPYTDFSVNVQMTPDQARRAVRYGDYIDAQRGYQSQSVTPGVPIGRQPAPIANFVDVGSAFQCSMTLDSFPTPDELYAVPWSIIMHGGLRVIYFVQNFGGLTINFGDVVRSGFGQAIQKNGIRTWTLAAGSGYTPGFYLNIPLTAVTGSGTGASAHVRVGTAGSGTTVTFVAITTQGTGFQVGDTVNASGIGPGSGFVMTLTAVGPLNTISYYDRIRATNALIQKLAPVIKSQFANGDMSGTGPYCTVSPNGFLAPLPTSFIQNDTNAGVAGQFNRDLACVNGSNTQSFEVCSNWYTGPTTGIFTQNRMWIFAAYRGSAVDTNITATFTIVNTGAVTVTRFYSDGVIAAAVSGGATLITTSRTDMIVNNDTVIIEQTTVTGGPVINGTWTATVISPTTFTIPVSFTGGTLTKNGVVTMLHNIPVTGSGTTFTDIFTRGTDIRIYRVN